MVCYYKLLHVLEVTRKHISILVVTAADIEQGYDHVDWGTMDTVLSYMDLGDNPFYYLYCLCQVLSEQYITGPGGLSTPFCTSRGIK